MKFSSRISFQYTFNILLLSFLKIYFSGIDSLTSSADKIDAGGSFELTCTHSAMDSGLQVAWTKNGQPITTGISPDGNTKSKLSVSSATKDDNGKYRCTVTFGSLGTDFKEVIQYVRLVEFTTPQYAINGDATHTITCLFYGDSLSATVWKFGATTLSDDSDYDIATSAPSDFSREDVLTINTIEAANEGSYQCSAQYVDGQKAITKDISLTVFGKSNN